MTLLTVPNTFTAGQKPIPSAKFNENYKAITDALSGLVSTIEFVFSFNGGNPVLTLNQRGSGYILRCEQNGALVLGIKNNGQIESTLSSAAPFVVASTTKVDNLNADQIDGLEAAAFVPIAGGTLTGFLTLHASPTAALHAANKQYVDTVVGNTFPSGTKFLFGGAIPAGWTRSDETEDRLIKLAKSGETIGSAGGSWSITGVSSAGVALTTAQIPSHNHTISYDIIGLAGGAVGQTISALAPTGLPNTINTSNTGSGQEHSHNMISNGSWRPRYEVWVVATKN